jgi:hypothetical protein
VREIIGGDGALWRPLPDGGWQRWDIDAARWEYRNEGPPEKPTPIPDPPAAEPPASPSRSKGRLVPLAALLVVAVSGAALGVADYLGSREPDEGSPPVSSAPSTKPSTSPEGDLAVYDIMLMAQDCLVPGAVVDPPTSERMSEQIAAVSQAVERLRGLEFKASVEREFLSPEQMQKRVAGKSMSKHPRKIRFETKVLASLGVVEPGIDIERMIKKYSSTQVSGYYMPGKKKLVVEKKSGELRAEDEVVVAHELEHALADQNFDFPRLNVPDPERGDELLATRALIEGDATLTMQQYALAALDPEEQQKVFALPEGGAKEAAKIPYALEKSFAFPYNEGSLFICDLYLNGGWDAVNEAYRNPPSSTSQILFPDRYRRNVEPVDPTDPPALPKRWKKVDTYSLGASDLLWMFAAPHGEEIVAPAVIVDDVSRWNGGEIHAWRDGDDLAVVAGLVDGGADGVGDEEPVTLCERMGEWYDDAFPEAQPVRGHKGLKVNRLNFSVMACSEEGVRLGLTSDRDTAIDWLETLGS